MELVFHISCFSIVLYSFPEIWFLYTFIMLVDLERFPTLFWSDFHSSVTCTFLWRVVNEQQKNFSFL